MSKQKTKNEILMHKNDSISNFSQFLDNLINSSDIKEQKKADLISYWIKDFQQYISQETGFDSKRIKAYKRGDVIKVNLGFNVGSEQGGLRYAIVLDKDNKHNAKTITIIPLTSLKEEKKVYERDVLLGKELYNKLKSKYDALSDELNKKINDNKLKQEQINSSVIAIRQLSKKEQSDDSISNILSSLVEMLDEQEKEASQLTTDLKSLEKIKNEIAKMKEGSIAKIEQITTISKQRIFDPKKNTDVLSGISFSSTAMDKINEKIKDLFIF